MVLDLDVASPEEVAPILRQATEKFYDSSEELKSAWQDKKAGKIWQRIGLILDAAADKIEKEIQKQ